MHIEFIDLFRCPRPHEESVLVAVFERRDGRLLVDGWLTCPVCDARYRVAQGVAYFSDPAGEEGVARAPARATGGEDPDPAALSEAEEASDALRLGAMLGIPQSGGVVVLEGARAASAERLAQLTGARVIVWNPIRAMADQDVVCTVFAAGAVPLAPGVASGVAIGSSGLSPASVPIGMLRQRGRLVLPSSAIIPPGFRELARDDVDSVSEKIGELVTLRR